MTTSPLSKTFARTLGHNLLICLTLAAVLILGMATQDKESVSRPQVTNANTLIADHGCANQDDPTHAVITIGGVTKYVGQKATDRAIEQAAFGIDHGIKVHAFCA